MDFQMFLHEEKVPEGFEITTCAQARANPAGVRRAYSNFFFEQTPNGPNVRLKDGVLKRTGEIEAKYERQIKYKLVSRPESGVEPLAEEGCLVALAFAAEHDDVEEVQELVKWRGTAILHAQMPSAHLGTILHVCMDFASLQTLHHLGTAIDETFDACVRDVEGDTALHNLPNWFVKNLSQEDYKKAVSLLLELPGVSASKVLEVQNNYGRLTVLCKALVYKRKDVCEALLDAAKEKEELEKPGGIKPGQWLALTAEGWRIAKAYGLGEEGYDPHTSRYIENLFCTALHLAILRVYPMVVQKILTYSAPSDLNLTSLLDHDNNTSLHVAARIEPGKESLEICEMLLKYDARAGLEGVKAKNKEGESPLHIASANGYAGICEKLLQYGASVSAVDNHDKYPLTNAFAKGDIDTVKILLEACIPPESLASPADLSVSTNPNPKESLVKKRFGSGLTPLHVAVAISSWQHIRSLLRAGALVETQSEDGRTSLHIAAEQCEKESLDMLVTAAKNRANKDEKRWKQLINEVDSEGQTALHKLLGKQASPTHTTAEIGADTSGERESANTEEITQVGESSADSSHNINEIVKNINEMVKVLLEEGAWVDVQDCKGETPLHAAARTKDRTDVVRTLLETAQPKNFGRLIHSQDRDKWIGICDFSGETALHAAAKAGEEHSLKALIEEAKSSDKLLQIRDMRNKTALDWVRDLSASQTSKDQMRNIILQNRKELTRDFLLWHEKHQYPLKENPVSLLRAAIEEEDVDIARELINRGADVTPLGYDARCWLAQSLGKLATDQPTLEDTLGRKELVQGVATLLLSPYTKAPITVGIFGSWGTGKSSFMLQVDEAIVSLAVKQTFRMPLPSGKDSSMTKFTKSGAKLRCGVERVLKKLMIKEEKMKQSVPKESTLGNCKEEDILSTFSTEFQLNHGQLFKSLALIDRSKLVQSRGGALIKKKARMYNEMVQDVHLIAYTPAMLTLHYNAWKYDNRNEASAGLAVEITQQLESMLTPHQWLKMSWKNSWRQITGTFLLHLLYPYLVAFAIIGAIVSIWIFVPAIALGYKYASLPALVLGLILAFSRTCLKVLQPVTQSMLEKGKFSDHQSMLGYQHQVVEDINFLKGQLCESAHLGWMILSLFYAPFISNSYFMEGTWILKRHPSSNNFRIVVFIDDLDRCNEKTILEILRATNLILGLCGVNVVIGNDKDMVHRTLIIEFLKDNVDQAMKMWSEVDSVLEGKSQPLEISSEKQIVITVDKEQQSPQKKSPTLINNNIVSKISQEKSTLQNMEPKREVASADNPLYTHELAENYLQKIIQVPIHLPDPSTKHVEHFLQRQTGQPYLPKPGEESIQEPDNGPQQYKSEPTAFQFLLASYTPSETDMLKKLSQLATKETRVPREWKRFLNYHRLAWSILSQNVDMRHSKFNGWQRKLILWIFICWNWRSQMDVIFQNWHILSPESAKRKTKSASSNVTISGGKNISLSDIIVTYALGKQWNVMQTLTHSKKEQEAGDLPKAWKDLLNTLRQEFDIPIHFVEKFQQFRFYCKLNHLEIGE